MAAKKEYAKSIRYRNVCATYNNPVSPAEVCKYLEDARVKYYVFGVEFSENGTPHLQMYMEFSTKIGLKELSKMFNGAKLHYEERHGTAEVASNYCKKGLQSHAEWKELQDKGPNYGLDAQVYSAGTLSNPGKRGDLAQVAEAIKQGSSLQSIFDEFPTAFIQYGRGIQFARNMALQHRDGETRISTAVFWGGTETGKTTAARQWLGDCTDGRPAYIKSGACGKWFQEYDGEDCVLFDEFRGQLSGIDPVDLLTLLDKFPTMVQNKNGSCKWCATKIAITSPDHPKDWYPDFWTGTDKYKQLDRRIFEIHDMGDIPHPKADSLDESLYKRIGRHGRNEDPAAKRARLDEEDIKEHDRLRRIDFPAYEGFYAEKAKVDRALARWM